ncbi:HugZ family protein [Acidocella sp.]|uniref:HugZ family pyridoxamine 5'-phosphate oxidase n=1 Tax=Acidocella sp. TaxID=50710 RepID=UPI002614093E|nr:pyridoxamine 5'-phosphate oxidase family protein [Acidocella sp.]
MARNQEYLTAAAGLMRAMRQATLATLDKGLPFASLVTPALDEDGAPLLLLSGLAAHTRHLRANPACALLIAGPAVDDNPQTAPRLCLQGEARPVAGEAQNARYLAAHPYAARYIGFGDFGLWKLDVRAVQFVGGFGAAGRLDFAALQHEISQNPGAAQG